VRFDSARAAGLTEDKASLVTDGYEHHLSPGETALLQLTDALIGDPHRLSEETRLALQAHFATEEIVEAAMGVGLFLGMSKVLICLGWSRKRWKPRCCPHPAASETPTSGVSRQPSQLKRRRHATSSLARHLQDLKTSARKTKSRI
jgi:hypothetical protein